MTFFGSGRLRGCAGFCAAFFAGCFLAGCFFAGCFFAGCFFAGFLLVAMGWTLVWVGVRGRYIGGVVLLIHGDLSVNT